MCHNCNSYYTSDPLTYGSDSFDGNAKVHRSRRDLRNLRHILREPVAPSSVRSLGAVGSPSMADQSKKEKGK